MKLSARELDLIINLAEAVGALKALDKVALAQARSTVFDYILEQAWDEEAQDV